MFSSSTSTRIRRSFEDGAEPFSPELDLPGRLLAGDVENRQAPAGQFFEDLQEERRFPDAGIAPDQDRGAADDPAAQDAVQFGDPRPEPFPLVGRDGLDGLRNAVETDIGRTGRIGVPDLLFDETVPFAAGGAPAQPFRRLLAAILAEKQGLDLFHGDTSQSAFRVHTLSLFRRQSISKNA